MCSTFRNEVFSLCKFLQAQEAARGVGTLLRSLSLSSLKEDGTPIPNEHGDFTQIARYFSNQFHGYLFVDDNIDSLDLPTPLEVNKLTDCERALLEQGHITLIQFVNKCLSDLHNKLGSNTLALSPYSLFREVKYDKATEPLLTNAQLQPAVEAFKNGKVYRALVASNTLDLLRKVDYHRLLALINSIEKEIQIDLSGKTSKSLKDFSMAFIGGFRESIDVKFAYVILMDAIRESLKTACQMLFDSISGEDLIVLSNDNIINIETDKSNGICHTYHVLVQGFQSGVLGNSIGSTLLIDCDYSEFMHIHEFGRIYAISIALSGEEGSTTRYKFTTLNDELIPFHPLSDRIIKAKIPLMNMK